MKVQTRVESTPYEDGAVNATLELWANTAPVVVLRGLWGDDEVRFKLFDLLGALDLSCGLWTPAGSSRVRLVEPVMGHTDRRRDPEVSS